MAAARSEGDEVMRGAKLPGSMNWYAVHTKPRQESVVQVHLEKEGLTTFFPKLRRKKTVRRKYQWIVGPLFPCYVFARFDISKSGRLVRYARGVSNIVSFGGRPAVVDDSIIETIQGRCEQDTVTIQPPKLTKGDEVEIQEGPFSGLRGIFERELSGAERVVILLQSITAGVRLEVSRSQLERI